eukprot:TRINITY_DN60609_c0_g1_i1.p1 TRINITY_DN60609_c0_g1~~TRINITY_DN60609_c0_g1_i1.p1  ORF type:complete len:1259 (+),score=354.77 TRINITY_DN60609_c0_g1_i1:92-3868(+)
MQIFVEAAGKTYTIEIEWQESIYHLMEKIASKLGLPSSDLVLYFETKRLERGRFVSDYGLRKESTVHFIRCVQHGLYATILPQSQPECNATLPPVQDESVKDLVMRTMQAYEEHRGRQQSVQGWVVLALGSGSPDLACTVKTKQNVAAVFRDRIPLAFVEAADPKQAGERWAHYLLQKDLASCEAAERWRRRQLEPVCLDELRLASMASELLLPAERAALNLLKDHRSLLDAVQSFLHAVAHRRFSASSPACVASLEAIAHTPHLETTAAAVSDWLRRRAEAAHQRALLQQAQGAATPGSAGERDAVRKQARAAQQQLIDFRGAPALADVTAVYTKLTDLREQCRKHGAGPGVCPAPASWPEALRLAAGSARAALEALAEGSGRVRAAEERTDGAGITIQEAQSLDLPQLAELAAKLAGAAEAETIVQGEASAHLAASAAAAEAVIELIRSYGLDRQSRAEAEAALAELAEGCAAADGAGGVTFYDRVRALAAETAPSAGENAKGRGPSRQSARSRYEALLSLEGILDPKEFEKKRDELRRLAEQEEAAMTPAESMRVMQREAEALRAGAMHSDPAEEAELLRRRQELLQRLSAQRKARAAEAAELLRIARLHFPECVPQLWEGVDGRIRSELEERRPEALQLLLGGGSLADYTETGELASSKRHTVTRAETADCTPVVIKKVPLRDESSMRLFARGLAMMHAAGEAAAAVRGVFLDRAFGQGLGCVVMDCYPTTLADWPPPGVDISGAAVLRMAQLLLAVLVRLHSPTKGFPDGIVHGDIAPTNIVVSADGAPRLIDFELARDPEALGHTTVTTFGMTPAYAAPELQILGRRDPSQHATKACDVFSLGATLHFLLDQPRVKQAAGAVLKHLAPLCARMTRADPAGRPSAFEALAASDITAAAAELERQLLQGEQQLGQREQSVAEERDRVARERQQLREGQQRVAAEQEELRAQEATLAEQRERVESERGRLQARLAAVAKLREAEYDSPAHWTAALAQGWAAVPVPGGSEVFSALSRSLSQSPSRGALEIGRLTLKRAWRLENPARWREYAVARQSIADAIQSGELPKSELRIRQDTAASLGPVGQQLPAPLRHPGGVNELRLFHGTKPEHVLSILADGMNERFCGGLFGHGTYFAENPWKSHHYTAEHRAGEHPDLVRHLYAASAPEHRCRYILVCRVVCGAATVTSDGHTQHFSGAPLWAPGAVRRELAKTPNGGHYSSLLAVPGGLVAGYREIVIFRGQRIYPEYLLAYGQTV